MNLPSTIQFIAMKQTDIAADLIKIKHPCYNFDDQSVYFIQS